MTGTVFCVFHTPAEMNPGSNLIITLPYSSTVMAKALSYPLNRVKTSYIHCDGIRKKVHEFSFK